MPALANRLSLAATVGAGRTRKMATAVARTAEKTDASSLTDMRPPPLADFHIKVRPARLKAAQASAYKPKRRSIACAPLTAMRPAAAAREKVRSRRDGT